MDRAVRIGLLCAQAVLLSGCFLADRNSDTNFTAAKLAYANPESPVDVPELIVSAICSAPLQDVQRTTAASLIASVKSCLGAANGASGSSPSYPVAMAAFYQVYTNSTDGAFARNRVQDAIMKAADDRCGTFKVELARADSFEQTSTGIISVLAGGLGGLVTGTDGARALAATAGIAGGTGAVINKVLFRNESLKVIASGIDLKRLELTQEFEGKRKKPLADYTLESAIRDGIRYNDACNVFEGLSKISDTVASGGGGAKAPDSPMGTAISRIDALSADQFRKMVGLDPKKPAGVNATATMTQTELTNSKLAYKKDVIAADQPRLDRIKAMLDEAEKQ